MVFMNVITVELKTCLVDRQPKPRPDRAFCKVTQQVGECQFRAQCLFPYQAASEFKGWGPSAF